MLRRPVYERDVRGAQRDLQDRRESVQSGNRVLLAVLFPGALRDAIILQARRRRVRQGSRLLWWPLQQGPRSGLGRLPGGDRRWRGKLYARGTGMFRRSNLHRWSPSHVRRRVLQPIMPTIRCDGCADMSTPERVPSHRRDLPQRLGLLRGAWRAWVDEDRRRRRDGANDDGGLQQSCGRYIWSLRQPERVQPRRFDLPPRQHELQRDRSVLQRDGPDPSAQLSGGQPRHPALHGRGRS